jgi:hypothetical protein
MEMSTNFVTALVTIATVTGAISLGVWQMRRRAAFRSGLAVRGLLISRHGEITTITPDAGDWSVTMTRSFASQMSPPGSHIVVSTWTSPSPRADGAALVVGPAPPPGLRSLTVALLGSATPAMTELLGIDRVSGGRPLQPLGSVDERLLAFATPGYPSPGHLTGLAEAISSWCSRFGSEREQPAVTVDDSGCRVRVRIDVLRSLDQVDSFIELCLRCRDGLVR